MPRPQCRVSKIWCGIAALARRSYSTAIAEQVIELSRVFEPRKQSSVTHAHPSILLYFPRGPLLPDNAAESATLDLLLERLPETHLVRVDYSTSEHPQPVHDAVAAFDWTVEHLLPKHPVMRAGTVNHSTRIATCGELYGATMALVLALTECKIGQAGICAAAVSNPIMDWTDLDTTMNTRSMKQSADAEGPALDTGLRNAKEMLFKDDRGMLDPFASPMFFFRSSGITPLSSQATQTMNDHDEDSGDQEFLPTSLQEALHGKTLEQRRGPRYSHQFPSKSLRLSLPALNISTGLLEPFRRQGLELAKQMDGSYTRQYRASEKETKQLDPDWTYDHDLEHRPDDLKPSAIHTNRLAYNASAGLSLWDSSREGIASLTRTTDWLHERLNNA